MKLKAFLSAYYEVSVDKFGQTRVNPKGGRYGKAAEVYKGFALDTDGEVGRANQKATENLKAAEGKLVEAVIEVLRKRTARL